MTIDWKFFVMLLVTIAGIAVPVWLWRADLSSRSLTVRIVSQTALQPEGVAGVPGLKVSVDGTELLKPFLTVVEVTNDGSRPIASAEFEEPISITVEKGQQVARAQVTSSMPSDLNPKVSVGQDKVSISPLLLNPGDLISMAIVTSGDSPRIGARSRVNGIKTINLEDRSAKTDPGVKVLFQSLVGFTLLFVYISAGMSAARPARFEISRAVLGIAALASNFGGFVLLIPLRDKWGLSPVQFAFAMLVPAVLAMFLG